MNSVRKSFEVIYGFSWDSEDILIICVTASVLPLGVSGNFCLKQISMIGFKYILRDISIFKFLLQSFDVAATCHVFLCSLLNVYKWE